MAFVRWTMQRQAHDLLEVSPFLHTTVKVIAMKTDFAYYGRI